MSAPKLRFPEFEGEWEEKRLDEVASVARGKFSARPRNDPQFFGGNIPFVQTGDIVNASRYLTKFTQTLNALGVGVSRVFPAQTILITIAANIGDVAITKFPVACPDSLVAINTRPTTSTEFLFEYLTTRKNELDSYATQNAQANINLQILGPLRVPAPPLPEQKKIAAFFWVVDDKIAALRDRQAGLERYKRGLMQALFSRRLRFTKPDGTPFPEWEDKRLGDAADVNLKSKELPLKFNYIDLESVTNGVMAKVQEIEKAVAPSRAQRLLSQGDILFQTVRPYQRNNLYFDQRGAFVASTGYAQIRAKQNRQYLFQILHTDLFVNKVMKRCTGTSYPAINSNDLVKIRMPFPHPDEQKKIADALSAMDTKIQAVAGQVVQMQSFKKGLLQQMFV